MTATRPTRLAAAVIVAMAAATWAGALAAAPIVAASDRGGPFAWGAALAYRAGSVICHQQDARSLHPGGVRMPVCARCAGLYAGGALGALAALAWVIGSAAPLRLPPGLPEWLSPVAAVVPGQLLAFQLSRARGFNPDQPRGLKKVTRTS